VDVVEADVSALHTLDVQSTEVLVAQEAAIETPVRQAQLADGESALTEGANVPGSPEAAAAEPTLYETQPETRPETHPGAQAVMDEPPAQSQLAAAIVAAMNAATPPDLPTDDVAEIVAIEDERPLDDAVAAAPADVPLAPVEAPLPEVEALLALESPVATLALEPAPMPAADAPSKSLEEEVALLFDTTLGAVGESAPGEVERSGPEPAAPEPAAPGPAEGESPAPAQAYDPLEETPHKDDMLPLPPPLVADEPIAPPGASDPLESHDPLEGPARS
ncbi:MAG: hypothetical protein ACRC1H_13570, partial [Caldilineaceae bacterium]